MMPEFFPPARSRGRMLLGLTLLGGVIQAMSIQPALADHNPAQVMLASVGIALCMVAAGLLLNPRVDLQWPGSLLVGLSAAWVALDMIQSTLSGRPVTVMHLLEMVLLSLLGFTLLGTRAARSITGVLGVFLLVLALRHPAGALGTMEYLMTALLLGLVWFMEAYNSRLASEQQRSQALETAATVDSLTELANRRAVEGWFAASRLDREGGAVMLLDLDHFKQWNDTFGHQVGDEVLVYMARLLERSVRSRDLVGRWGGEEFIVLLRGVTPGQARRVAERITYNLRHDPGLARYGRALTVSGGVAFITGDESLEHLVATADGRLYAAKRGGRDRFVWPP